MLKKLYLNQWRLIISIDSCIARAYLNALGKTTAITKGETEYDRFYALADRMTKTWQNEPGVDWMSLYDLVNIGTVSQTDTVALDDSIRTLSQREGDSIIVTNTKGTWYYDIVRPDQLLQFSLIGSPVACQRQKNLVFGKAFVANDPQLGASITVPSFLYVEDVTSGTDDVQVDDPEWLALAMAAERVRTDLVRQAQYGNLVALANDRMQAMIQNNEAQLQEIPIDEEMAWVDPNYGSSAWL